MPQLSQMNMFDARSALSLAKGECVKYSGKWTVLKSVINKNVQLQRTYYLRDAINILYCYVTNQNGLLH